MADYRLYCLDGTGRFTKAHEINAGTDQEAIQEAQALKLPVACELWERARKVAVVEPAKL